MDFFNRLKQQTPKPQDLIQAAANDYHAATQVLTEARAKLEEARAAVPALSECMGVMKAAVEAARTDLEALADERLKYFLDPHFDPQYVGELDLTANQRYRSMINTAFALTPGPWLELAEQRLRKMGADKSKLTFAQKAKRIAELEADIHAVGKAQEDALRTWRTLTNQRSGYPE